MIVFLLKKVKN